MAHYTPIQDEYDDEESLLGADVGYYNYAPPQRSNTSARRYTVDRSVDPTTTLRKASQSAVPTRSRAGYNAKTIDYNEMGDDEVRYGSNFARRTTGSRPRTAEDPQVTTNIRRVDTSAASKQMSRRKVVGTIVGSVLGGIIGGNIAINAIHNAQLRWAQGPIPVKDLELVCGHGDSETNKTLLHVHIWNYIVVSTESPGGNHGKDHEVVGTGLPTTGDISTWDLEVVPVKIGPKQYEIEITVTGVAGTGQIFVYHWLLVDSGKGYFVGADTK